MKLITEVYHDGYQPKPYSNHYAYFVDDTNRGIVYRMARHYLNSIKHWSIEQQLDIYKNNVKQNDCIVYFSTSGLSYDCLGVWQRFDDTYAAENNYNVIKITESKSLISMD